MNLLIVIRNGVVNDIELGVWFYPGIDGLFINHCNTLSNNAGRPNKELACSENNLMVFCFLFITKCSTSALSQLF